jgi:hypothetical protein
LGGTYGVQGTPDNWAKYRLPAPPPQEIGSVNDDAATKA